YVRRQPLFGNADEVVLDPGPILRSSAGCQAGGVREVARGEVERRCPREPVCRLHPKLDSGFDLPEAKVLRATQLPGLAARIGEHLPTPFRIAKQGSPNRAGNSSLLGIPSHEVLPTDCAAAEIAQIESGALERKLAQQR